MIVLAIARNIAFSIVFYGGSAVLVLTALVLYPFAPDTVVPISRRWFALHGWATRWMLGQRLRIVGAMPDAPVLYAIKHESMYETIATPYLFRRAGVMAKQELLDIPFWGKVGKRYGLIGVEREAGAKAMREMIAQARAVSALGRPIILFPEGTRVPHGAGPELKAGFAGLYKMLKLPVIPVALDSGRLSPRGRWLKKSGTITYLVGETIPPGLDRDEAEARVHHAINALNREPAPERQDL